jgi:pimeloyl-ACP methyl ester carboxylesterase
MVSGAVCAIVDGMTTRDARRGHMSDRRTHQVTTTDRTTIGGTVHGQGPPLVFVHGTMVDGDIDWQALLPHLTDRFTCYLPSTRGRGLSDDHPDHTRGRRVDDIVEYLDSIGEPTGLVGFSSGGGLALAVAAQSDAVTAVAVYEPALPPGVWPEQQREAVRDTVARMGELAATGRFTDAARAWADFVFHDEEVAALERAGYLEATYVPVLLNDIQQGSQSEGPSSADPEILGRIGAPVLVLHGPDTINPLFAACVRHVADHVPNTRIQQIPDAGHAAPLTHPETLAEALIEFFSPARQPA